MLCLAHAHLDAGGELGHFGLPLGDEVAGRNDERRAAAALAGQDERNDGGGLARADGVGQDAAPRLVLGELAGEGVEARAEGAVLLDEEAPMEGPLLVRVERQGHRRRRRGRGMGRRQAGDGQRRAVSLLGGHGGGGGQYDVSMAVGGGGRRLLTMAAACT